MLASELSPLATKPLPEIPVEAGSRGRADTPPAAVPDTAAARITPAEVAAAEPVGAPAAAGDGAAPPRRSSRRGGAILLGVGAAVVVAVVLVLLLSGGSSKKPASTVAANTSTGTSTTPTTGTTSTAATKVVAQINLKPPAGGKSPVGIAEVLREQGKTGIAIVAQGLTPNTKKPANAYAVWLSTRRRTAGFSGS